MGGRLWCEPAEPAGARFVVALPAAACRLMAPVNATRALRILVVDDDPAMVGAITALVSTEGHQVITAYDGLTAVRRFREEGPTSSCWTWRCPARTASRSPARSGPPGTSPIIVVSGESGEPAKVRALGIGADDYLTKPFGKAELLARIAAVMRRAEGTGRGLGAGRRPPDDRRALGRSRAATRRGSAARSWT